MLLLVLAGVAGGLKGGWGRAIRFSSHKFAISLAFEESRTFTGMDRIVEVNGVSGESNALVQALKNKQRLAMVVHPPQ
eukprot:6480631-Amphidinium_carterae.1